MIVRLESALHSSMAELAEVLTASFADYVVPMQFTPSSVAKMTRLDSLDLDASQVLFREDKAIGAALMARRGLSSRLAAMAIAPPFRGQGLGRKLLEEVVAAERDRGTREISLEVIEENEAAVKLYEGAGFTVVRRLAAFLCEQPAGSTDEAEVVDLREVGQAMIRWAPPDLPWQVSGETVIQLGPPVIGFRLADAFAALTIGDESEVWLRCICVAPDSHRQGEATRLIRALFARYPTATWKVTSLLPEHLSSLFLKLGFVEYPLAQKQMALAVNPSLE